MKNLHFSQKTADITKTQPHSVLKEYELDFVPNDYFIGMLKKYGLYERPILDMDGNAITHYADIMAARANGDKQLEVYEVDMDELELKLFILSKHTYCIKKVKRSFQIAAFYRDYLTTNTEGIKLAKTIKGNINVKIAHLMGTSESTVKRLLYIGQSRKADEHFNMIEEGNKSLQETRGLVNEELNSTPTSKEDGDGDKNEVKEDEATEVEPNGKRDSNDIDKIVNLIPVTPDKPIQLQGNSIKVNDNIISYGFDTEGKPFIEKDGKRLDDIHVSEIIHRDSRRNGKVKSIILTQRAVNGVSIQITVENIDKAA